MVGLFLFQTKKIFKKCDFAQRLGTFEISHQKCAKCATPKCATLSIKYRLLNKTVLTFISNYVRLLIVRLKGGWNENYLSQTRKT